MIANALKAFFYFPQIVNDWTARMVALQVVIWASIFLWFEVWWIVPLLAIGFWLRVGFGPRYSPAAKIASKVLVPRLHREEKPIAGTPKRFAQFIGAFLTTSATLSIPLGFPGLVRLLMSILLFFAFLEAAFGFCAGCTLYRALSRWGLFQPEICVDCVLKIEHSHTGSH